MKNFFASHLRLVVEIIFVLVVGGAVWYVFSSTAPALGSYTVAPGNIVSFVDIPGVISSSNSVNLSFQESGQIAKIYVKEGESVAKGKALASLDDSAQQTALNQEEAVLAAAQANYKKLLAGATQQNVQTSQDSVNSAEQNLTNAYGGAANTLNNAYTAMFNSYSAALSIQNNYFANQDPEGALVQTSINDVYTNMQDAQVSLNAAEKSMAPGDMDTTVVQMISALNNVYGDLNTIRAQCDQGGYYSKVSPASKASLDSQKTSVNVALTGVTNLQQNIASLKLALQTAQDQLRVTTAPPTQADIDAAKAQVTSAQAEIDNAQLTIDHATVVAPFSGIIRNVVAEPGMVVSPDVPVFSIINNGIMKIDAYASETDVPKVREDATTTITLDSYGNGVNFPAKVAAVDTAETTYNGSPAYHVTLYFIQPDDRIRAGMTGNAVILAAEHDNVVEVPSRLVLNDNNDDFVLIQDNSGKNVRRQIALGLAGDDGMVEVVSGLSAGEKISNF